MCATRTDAASRDSNPHLLQPSGRINYVNLRSEIECRTGSALAGDGDFYDTLDLIKNVKHKELWVIDLQQLATKVLWIEDIFHGDDVAVVEGDESPPLSQLPTVPRGLLVDSASDKAAASSVVTDQIPVKTPPAHPLSVFVNNLPFDTEKAEIESHFQPHGEVKSVRMPVDPQMGKCRGFAFVQFDSIEGVESALTSSGQDFRGRKLRVRRPFEHRGLPAADVPATTSTSKPTKTSKRKKNQDAADDGKPKRNKTDTTPRPADAVSTMWQLSLQRTLNCIVYSWLMCLGNVAKHAKYVPTVIDLCDDEEGHKELNSDKSD
ncbi:hypothetical protein DYB28_006794 [Aphanomyces astaci]|uniref:RRM domain-containing protein n=1 Tax=Aphanomyces astaci TaxID=112090 RepID=A0A9X8DVR5_APHAT|nr:hypothetical protein DYB28_006794 [Aphanomyces astaci]